MITTLNREAKTKFYSSKIKDQRQLYKTLNRMTQCNKCILYPNEDASSLPDKFSMFFNKKELLPK